MKKLTTILIGCLIILLSVSVAVFAQVKSGLNVEVIKTATGDELFKALPEFRPETNLRTEYVPEISVNAKTGGTIFFQSGFEESWTWGAPPGWTYTPAANANNSWHRNDFTTGWSSVSGAYSPVSYMGGFSARFHSYDAAAGQIGTMTTPNIDLSTATDSVFISFWWTNTSGTDTLFIDFSTDGGTTFNTLGFVLTTGGPWYRVYGHLPTTSSTTQVRFRARSDYGANDIGLDEVIVYQKGPAYSGSLTLPGTFSSFTDLARRLTIYGVSGPTTIAVTAGTYLDSVTFPPIQGASATNTITIVNTGGAVTVQRGGVMTHGTTVGSYIQRTDDATISLWGADYMTFDGIGISDKPGVLQNEWGYHVRAFIPTDGANYNTIQNCLIVMNKTNTSSRGIRHFPFWVLTAQSGASSYNKYYNNDIRSCGWQGILLQGGAPFIDLMNEVASVAGGTARIFDIGGGTGSANAISISGQNGVRVYGLDIDSIWATSGAVNAILLGTGTTVGDSVINFEIYNNQIRRLVQTAGTSATILTGIRVPGHTNALRGRIYNNFVSNLRSNGTHANDAVLAFYHQGGGATFVEWYYNTTLVNNMVIGTNGGSSVFRVDGGVATIRNNVLVNLSAQSGTGKNYVYRRTGGTILSSNNALYIDTVLTNRFIGFYTTDRRSLPAWQSAVPGLDLSSVYENPNFVNSSTLPYDLHINPAIATRLESGGINIPGITTDYDGDTRAVASKINTNVAPDIGADEFSGTPIDEIGPEITYTPLPNTHFTTNRSLTTIIKDPVSGVNEAAGLQPRLYYKKGALGAYYIDSSGVKIGNQWTFTFDHSLLGGVSGGDTVYYYVGAADSSSNVSTNPFGGSGLTPPGNVPPTILNFYRILPTMSGTYTIGTGGDYSTIKAFFDAINSSIVTGNITGNIISDLTETASASLNPIIEDIPGSNYTITIKPVGAARLVSGNFAAALIDLNGADRVTFDGDISGIKGLTFRNISTTGQTFVLRNGAEFNTITNCVIEGANTSTTSGTIVFSTSAGPVGNRNNTISNNDIRDRSDAAGVPANAIYSSGTAGFLNATNTISGNNIFNWTNAGILLTSTGLGDGWVINPNHFYQTASRSTAQTAISVGAGSGHTISGNFIGGSAPNCGGSAWTNTGAVTFTGISLAVGTVTTTSVEGNTIQNISLTSTGAASFRGIDATAGHINIMGNIIGHASTSGSITTAGSALQRGIFYSGTGNVFIHNNLIANILSTTTTGTVGTRAIEISGGVASIKFNEIRNISASNISTWTDWDAAVLGIENRSSLAGQVIEKNVIHTLTAAHSGTTNVTAQAIRVTGGSGSVLGNNIYNIVNNSTGTGPNLFGIHIPGGSSWTVANNMIHLGHGLSNNLIIQGIRDNALSTTTNFYYFNSVCITGEVSAGANNTYAFNRISTTIVTLRNNIFSNFRTGGTGFHVSIANTNAAATGWAAGASNYNILYNVVGTHLAQWLGTAAANNRTFAGWRAPQGDPTPGSGGDANSYNADPQFMSLTVPDLHINPAVYSPADNNGIPIDGITTDFDGETGNRTTTPDIGADEYIINTPGSFALLTPDNGSVNLPLSGTLTWESSVAAGRYDVYLDVNNPPTTLVGENLTTTSYAYSSLLPNTTYYWSVNAKNSSGTVTASNAPFSFTTLLPPNAPSGLTLSNVTNDSMDLSWTDNSLDEIGFYIYKSTTGITFTKVDSVLADVTTYTGSHSRTLGPNVRYWWRVTAYNENGESGFTSADAWTLANTPGAPTLSDAGYTTMKVVLDPAGNPAATEFAVRVVYGATTKYMNTAGALVDAPVWGTYSAFGSAGGRVVTGLTPGTTYTFDVKARNGGNVETDFGTSASLATMSPVSTFPYVQNFDGATAEGWSTGIFSGTVNNWVRGTPAKTQISGPRSSPNAWVTKLTGTYDNNHNAFLLSPLFDFSSITQDPYLEFWHNFKTELNWDAGIVEYSIDGGSTWLRVDSTLGTGPNFSTPNSFNWYNNASTSGPITPRKFSGTSTAYAGHTSGWIKSTTKLVGLAGKSNVMLRWRFGTDGSGVDEGWAIDDLTIYTLPNAPTALNIVDMFADSMTFAWTDNSDNETGFYVYKSDNGTTFSKVDSVGENITAYYGTHSGGLTPNTKYWWRVSAYNIYGESGYTQADSTTLARTPGAPTINDITYSSMVVKIDKKDNPAPTEYVIRVEYSNKVTKYVDLSGILVDDPVWGTYSQFGGDGGITVTGLAQSTTYTYDVKARNANNIETPYGPSAEGTTGSAPPPNAPTALILANVTNDAMDLSWTDNSDDEIGFFIYKSTDGSVYVKVDSIGENVQTYTGSHSRSLVPNTRYWWRVAAYNENGVSGFTSADTVTLANIPGAPLLTDVSYTTMRVTLVPAGNPAPTEFAVRVVYGTTTKYMNTAGALVDDPVWGTYSAFGGVGGRVATGLLLGTNYTFDVKARNSVNIETPFGPSSSATTLSYPSTLSEDFATYTGFAPPPAGWNEGDQKDILDTGAPFGAFSNGGWINDNFGNTGTNRSARFNFYGTTDDHDWILSPNLSLTDKKASRLIFDIALTPWTGTTPTTMPSNDTMFVVISTDGGNTFTRANVVAAYHAGTPISNVGQTENISLAAYEGQMNVRIGFYAKDLMGAGDVKFFIDNVRLEAIVEKDIQVLSVSLTPGPPYYVGTPITVSALIKNNGSEPNPTTVPLTYKVGAAPEYQGDEVGQIFTPSWVGNTATVSFTTQYTPGATGSLTMFVRSFYPGDAVPANNIASRTIKVLPPGALFEDWTAVDALARWKVVNNDNGTKTWRRATEKFLSEPASVGSDWESTTLRNDDWLITPKLTVAAGDSFTFWHSARSTTWPESLYVRISTVGNNPSDPWIDLLRILDGTVDWKYKAIDLTPWAGQNVWIAFVNRGLDRFTIYVDDITGPALYTPVYDLAFTDFYQSSGLPTPKVDKISDREVWMMDQTLVDEKPIATLADKGIMELRETEISNTVVYSSNSLSSLDKKLNPINVKAEVTNVGRQAVAYTLNWNVSGVAQPTYTGPSVDSGATHIADLTFNPTARGTFLTTGAITVAGDENPDNNTNYFRMRVYPDQFTRTIYDRGDNIVDTWVGWGSATRPMKAGVRFTAPQTMRLAGVDFIYNTGTVTSGNIIVTVRGASDSLTGPGPVLYSKIFDAADYFTGAGDYVTFPFDDNAPVIAGGSDYWITIKFPAGILYPGAVHNTGFTPGRSFYEGAVDLDSTKWYPLVITTERAWIMRSYFVAPPNSIAGMKFNDLNGNGQKDPGEPGLEGWYINLNGPVNDVKITGPDGSYLFSDLPDGEYLITEDQQVGWIQTMPAAPGSYTVVVSGGMNVTGRDFGNFKLGKISGYKWEDMDGDGIWDAGEPTVANWQINLSGPVSGSTMTNQNGLYVFENLSAGEYVISENMPTGWFSAYPTPNQHVVNISSGTEISGNSGVAEVPNFGNARYGRVSGAKFWDRNNNSIRDVGEVGLANWTILLTGDRTATRSTITNANGDFLFENVVPDNYVLAEVLKPGWSLTASPAPFVVVSGAVVENKLFGNFYNIDSTKYRSFLPEILVALDSKGKLPKAVKRKPIGAYWEFMIINPKPYPLTLLNLQFKNDVKGIVEAGEFNVTGSKKDFSLANAELLPGDTLVVKGYSSKGKPQEIKKLWYGPKTTIPATNILPAYQYLELPLPTWRNVIDEIFIEGGFTDGGGLLVGQKGDPKKIGWVFITKSGDVVKSLYSKGMHTAGPKFFRTFDNNKPFLKEQKSLPPTKQNNKLFAEIVAAKLAIAASKLGKIPEGYGDLIYIDDDVAWHPFNEMTVEEIVDSISKAMNTFEGDSADYYRIMRKLNSAFAGPIDTVEFATRTVLTGVKALYEVPYLFENPSGKVSKIEPKPIVYNELPSTFELSQNYPNPFNPTTTIEFTLPEDAVVTLKVYNVLGQEVATLIDNEIYTEGLNEVEFDASELSSGVYFYRLIAETLGDIPMKHSQVKKMILMK